MLPAETVIGKGSCRDLWFPGPAATGILTPSSVSASDPCTLALAVTFLLKSVCGEVSLSGLLAAWILSVTI